MGRMIRWLKFNAVGALGMVVQLGALADFNRWMAGHYLVATAVARFHLSNGAVSIVGNLVLMRLLVEGAGMPVLTANGVAILVCSVVNFLLGDGWVFTKNNATVDPSLKRGRRSPRTGWTT